MSFVQFTPRPGSSEQASIFDFDSLQRLRRSVTSMGSGQQPDPAQMKNGLTDAEREVAQQFEAIFIQQVLKQARRSPLSTLMQSESTQFTQSLADQQASLELARSSGVGLAQNILDMIRGQRGNLDPLAAAPLPEQVSSSRLAQFTSTLGETRRNVAGSIDDLIGMLGQVKRAPERVYAAIEGAPAHIRSFVSRMSTAAQVAADQSGVPAKLILSQAALESGWGQREIMRPDGRSSHNIFGIKAGSSWKGDVVHVTTTEYQNGVPRKVKEPFRAYGSYQEAFADYAKLVGTNKRYADVAQAPTAEAAARRIQKAGYATDPAYADKLISIMGYFDTGRKLRA
ncbi:MAG: flagellar assembly peptidoglycan hydrolase FlgJ [Alcaligenaceae bacterium]|nr:flagellar assembly peptidoglycan hydrolase FlgJ [Alcaligenaceae bacterium]